MLKLNYFLSFSSIKKAKNMRKSIISIISSALLLGVAVSCTPKEQKTTTTEVHQNKTLTEKTLNYDLDGKSYASFVAFQGDETQKRPVVFVIPEWWGLNAYAKNRAKQLAELGYLAVAVDYYGNGLVVDHPEQADKNAGAFYKDAPLAKRVFDAAKEKAAHLPNADTSKMAVLGYCFGGAMALNMARQEADLKGAISFHGNLMTGVKPTNSNVKILVLNGAADSFVSPEEIAAFKKEMDSAKIGYAFENYPNAVHGFTNPDATELGKKFNLKIAYNKEADEKSWQKMKTFLQDIFK